MQVGWVKIGDFRQMTGYMSKTVQDRLMVSIKVEHEVNQSINQSINNRLVNVLTSNSAFFIFAVLVV